MNKTITATINDSDTAVRIAIPREQADEPTAGHRQSGTGYVRIGHHIGRRWGVVHDYSIWTQADGSVCGDTYTAYDLTTAGGRKQFALIVAGSHYTDLTTGRDVAATDLVNGACNRPAAPEEIEWLVNQDYSRDDAGAARVLAERNGAKLYHIPHLGYAVEGETGDGFNNLDLEEAIRLWC